MDQDHVALLLTGVVFTLLVIAVDCGWIRRFLHVYALFAARTWAKICKEIGHA